MSIFFDYVLCLPLFHFDTGLKLVSTYVVYLMWLGNDLGETKLQRLCRLIVTDNFLLCINITFGVNEVYLRSIGGKSIVSLG